MGKRTRDKSKARQLKPPSLDQRVTDYLLSIKSMPAAKPGDYDTFWLGLRDRHPGKAEELNEAMDSSKASYRAEEVFLIKNSSLDLALDVATGFSGDLYARQMQIVIERLGHLAPNRILDVGCDEGFLTCFLAELWPEAEVLGWDSLEEGLKCARELAHERLGLGERVTFQQVNLLDAIGRDERYDLVLASRALINQAIPRVEGPVGLTVENPVGVDEAAASIAITNLVSMVAEDGLLMIVDRMTKPSEAALIARLIEREGLKIDWSVSERFLADELHGRQQRIPVLIASHDGPGTHVTPTDGALTMFAREELDEGATFKASAAEAVARAMHRNRLLFSARVTDEYGPGDDETMVTCYEVWHCGPLLLAYETRSDGARAAQILTSNWEAEFVRQRLEDLEPYRNGYEVEIGTPPVLGVVSAD